MPATTSPPIFRAPVTRRAAQALSPYWLQIYLLAYTPPLLILDSRTTAVWQQALLGLATFGVLGLLATRVPREVAFQVAVCVAVATCFEIVGSLIWGLYHYRFHNLPLYVPAGHGLVYMFAIMSARTPLLQKHGRTACLVVLGVASGWAIAGLTVLVPLMHRVDVGGATLLPLLAWLLLRSRRATMFAAIFVAVTELELVGTHVGTWYWLPVAPFIHVRQGNPPSAVAAGYGIIDGTVLVVSMALLKLAAVVRPLRPALRATSPNGGEEASLALQVAAHAED